jgi:hypothetical protein
MILPNAQLLSFFPFTNIFAFCYTVLPGIPMKSKNFRTLVWYLSLVIGVLIALRNNVHGSNSDIWVISDFSILSHLIAQNPPLSTYIGTGPEGFEPSTNCSAGSHSIQTELWAQTFLIEFLI